MSLVLYEISFTLLILNEDVSVMDRGICNLSLFLHPSFVEELCSLLGQIFVDVYSKGQFILQHSTSVEKLFLPLIRNQFHDDRARLMV